MNIYEIVSWLALLVCLVPTFLLFGLKKLRHPFFIVLSMFWLWMGLVAVALEQLFPGESDNPSNLTMMLRLLEVPVLLAVMCVSLPFQTIRKHLRKTVSVFAMSMLVLLTQSGLTEIAERIVVLLGIFILLIYLCWTISATYLNNSKYFFPGSTKLYIYYALVFKYGSNAILYMLGYFHPHGELLAHDLELMQHVSIIITLMIISYAFLTYRAGAPMKLQQMKNYRDDMAFKYL